MLNICFDGREIPRKCQSAIPEPQVHIHLMAAKLLRCCISSETTEAQSPFLPQQGHSAPLPLN